MVPQKTKLPLSGQLPKVKETPYEPVENPVDQLVWKKEDSDNPLLEPRLTIKKNLQPNPKLLDYFIPKLESQRNYRASAWVGLTEVFSNSTDIG